MRSMRARRCFYETHPSLMLLLYLKPLLQVELCCPRHDGVGRVAAGKRAAAKYRYGWDHHRGSGVASSKRRAGDLGRLTRVGVGGTRRDWMAACAPATAVAVATPTVWLAVGMRSRGAKSEERSRVQVVPSLSDHIHILASGRPYGRNARLTAMPRRDTMLGRGELRPQGPR